MRVHVVLVGMGQRRRWQSIRRRHIELTVVPVVARFEASPEACDPNLQASPVGLVTGARSRRRYKRSREASQRANRTVISRTAGVDGREAGPVRRVSFALGAFVGRCLFGGSADVRRRDEKMRWDVPLCCSLAPGQRLPNRDTGARGAKVTQLRGTEMLGSSQRRRRCQEAV